MKKNGQLVYNSLYNYNIDTDFMNNYKKLKTSTNVVNIPVIQSVLYKLLGVRKYFKVVYSNI
jgi:hypothetical protein